MADEPVTDPHTILKKGQIVTATVVNVDTQLRRSQLSLKTHVEACRDNHSRRSNGGYPPP